MDDNLPTEFDLIVVGTGKITQFLLDDHSEKIRFIISLMIHSVHCVCIIFYEIPVRKPISW